MMTVMAPLLLKVKVIPIVSHIFYDATLEVCSRLEFKVITLI